MFDTHCHLNFQAFENSLDQVISEAKKAGVNQIIIPGTDVETSKKAIEIAEKSQGIYAAVGIHPHHVFELLLKARYRKFFNGKQKTVKNLVSSLFLENELKKIEDLLTSNKVVAVGEVGIDRHYYQKTRYEGYQISQKLVDFQKRFFIEQIKLAHKYKKALIIHSREATEDLLDVLLKIENCKLKINMVFHCCEPDKKLLQFAIDHKIFIGVDGDVTYWKEKQEFIKTVPIEMLVLETDSPFLMPRLLSIPRPLIRYNEPKNLVLIAEFIAKLLNVSINRLIEVTTENAKKLFSIK
ncbi:MAG: TatD family hydrolase [Candidatus Roizmanbacteria bacterium]|nr:TatD family hydrolase [Candidatus Roizmanbacteria bacterium]